MTETVAILFRALAAVPGSSLNARHYSKETLASTIEKWPGRPFLLDHEVKDVQERAVGILSAAKYGIDKARDGTMKEGLWLTGYGRVSKSLFERMQETKNIPAIVKSVSIGGEGEGTPGIDPATGRRVTRITRLLPQELSMVSIPGIPEAHIASVQRIEEAYKGEVDLVEITDNDQSEGVSPGDVQKAQAFVGLVGQSGFIAKPRSVGATTLATMNAPASPATLPITSQPNAGPKQLGFMPNPVGTSHPNLPGPTSAPALPTGDPNQLAGASAYVHDAPKGYPTLTAIPPPEPKLKTVQPSSGGAHLAAIPGKALVKYDAWGGKHVYKDVTTGQLSTPTGYGRNVGFTNLPTPAKAVLPISKRQQMDSAEPADTPEALPSPIDTAGDSTTKDYPGSGLGANKVTFPVRQEGGRVYRTVPKETVRIDPDHTIEVISPRTIQGQVKQLGLGGYPRQGERIFRERFISAGARTDAPPKPICVYNPIARCKEWIDPKTRMQVKPDGSPISEASSPPSKSTPFGTVIPWGKGSKPIYVIPPSSMSNTKVNYQYDKNTGSYDAKSYSYVNNPGMKAGQGIPRSATTRLSAPDPSTIETKKPAPIDKKDDKLEPNITEPKEQITPTTGSGSPATLKAGSIGAYIKGQASTMGPRANYGFKQGADASPTIKEMGSILFPRDEYLTQEEEDMLDICFSVPDNELGMLGEYVLSVIMPAGFSEYAPWSEAAKSKNWIKKAIKHPGALRKTMGVKAGEKIPISKLKAAAKGNSTTAKRARLALALRKMHKK